jgi:hypothetical protein
VGFVVEDSVAEDLPVGLIGPGVDRLMAVFWDR